MIDRLDEFFRLMILPLIAFLVTGAAAIKAVNDFTNQMAELWSRFRRGQRYFLILITQMIPVGAVIWYFLYYAAIYSDRLTEEVFFILIVLYPTLLITFFEIFWGAWLYPKLTQTPQLKPPMQIKKKMKGAKQ